MKFEEGERKTEGEKERQKERKFSEKRMEVEGTN